MAFLGSIGAAPACSGQHVKETIARNLATGQTGLFILGGILLVSLAIAIRSHRYAFPMGLAAVAVLVWLGLGTAYHGDCGSMAHDSGVLAVVLGVGALATQIVDQRLTMRKGKTAEGGSTEMPTLSSVERAGPSLARRLREDRGLIR